MINYSLDIETFGIKVDAPVIAIGACHFDIDTGDIISTFESNCTPSENSVYDINTIMWWLGQSDDARDRLVTGHGNAVDMSTALISLSEYLTMNIGTVCPWGNGATFDVSILERNYNSQGIDVPWKFYNIRDMRTLVAEAEYLGFDKSSIDRVGTHHGALDDAIHQAKVISAAHNMLIGNV